MRACLIPVAAASFAFYAPAAAQTTQQVPVTQVPAAPQQAQAPTTGQCLTDLVAFAQRANQDGYWLTGWGGGWGGWGAGVEAAGMGPGAAMAPGAAAAGIAPAPGGPPAATTTGTVAAQAHPTHRSPWGVAAQPPPAAGAMVSPRMQIRTLYSAASILGHRGDEQGCQAVLSELRQVYDGFIGDLQAAGIQPGEIITWRQEQIVAATPVTELEHATFRSDHVLGTDVRNARDEHLGSIDDLVLDPRTGEISHAIVAHGGFLGIGQDHVAVPWEMLRVTPWMNTFVLDVPQTVLEAAPRVDPDAFASPGLYGQYRQTVDTFWAAHRPT